MKVLLCSSPISAVRNGHALFGELVLDLSGSDIEVDLLSTNEKRADYSADTNPSFLMNVPVLSLLWLSYSFAREIKKCLQSKHYDLVFFNDLYLAYSFSRDYNGPIMAVIHDYNAITGMTEGRRSLTLLLKRKMERTACRSMTKVLCNSNYLKGLVQTYYNIDESRVSKLDIAFWDYNSVPYDFKSFNGSDVRILFVKRNFRQGGLQTVVNAISGIRDVKVTLTVVGNTKDEILANIEIPKSNSLDIEFRGEIHDREELIGVMRNNHILCIPSYNEAMGVTLAEGLALGMRVVASNVGGIPEVLDDGAAGYMVEPGNPVELRETLLHVLSNEDEAREKSLHGRKYVIQNYDRTRTLRQLSECFESVN